MIAFRFIQYIIHILLRLRPKSEAKLNQEAIDGIAASLRITPIHKSPEAKLSQEALEFELQEMVSRARTIELAQKLVEEFDIPGDRIIEVANAAADTGVYYAFRASAQHKLERKGA